MARSRGERKRKRHPGTNRFRAGQGKLFHNPWPYMSEPEAMVKLELNRLSVPYSWRNFDGNSPTLQALVPDFAPEFTLKEYNIVILVIGGFFGTLPGVLDKAALAAAALQQDGWKVGFLLENDIRNDTAGALFKQFPELANPTIRGQERPNPLAEQEMGQVFQDRREQLRAQAIHRANYNIGAEGAAHERERLSKRERIIRSSRRRRRGRGTTGLRTPSLRRPTG